MKPLQRVVYGLSPLLRGKRCVLSYTTPGVKTRRVHGARGAWAKSAMQHCFVYRVLEHLLLLLLGQRLVRRECRIGGGRVERWRDGRLDREDAVARQRRRQLLRVHVRRDIHLQSINRQHSRTVNHIA